MSLFKSVKWKKAYIAAVGGTLILKALENFLRAMVRYASGGESDYLLYFYEPLGFQLIYAFLISSAIFFVIQYLTDKYSYVIYIPMIWYLQHDIYNFIIKGIQLWHITFLFVIIEALFLGLPIGIATYYLVVEKDVLKRFL